MSKVKAERARQGSAACGSASHSILRAIERLAATVTRPAELLVLASVYAQHRHRKRGASEQEIRLAVLAWQRERAMDVAAGAFAQAVEWRDRALTAEAAHKHVSGLLADTLRKDVSL